MRFLSAVLLSAVRRLLVLCVLAAAIAVPGSGPEAARDATVVPGSGPRYEILVFERAKSTYCEVFRADVATRYREQPQAAKMPMRFVDIDKVDTTVLALKTPLRIVPTAVVMKDGVEVDRVQGLTSAQQFLLLVRHIAGPLD